ncbi:hypothetical protein ANO11243_089720 [Dothideomycetidae sp. 11243]|nr:hypothetical protein ANO11243_089720 [fungal sp. No.11243]
MAVPGSLVPQFGARSQRQMRYIEQRGDGSVWRLLTKPDKAAVGSLVMG